MTQKDIVKSAVALKKPPRTPLYFCNRDIDKSDVIFTGYVPDPDFVPDIPGRTEWGYRSHSLDDTMGQPDLCPLEDSWEQLEGFKPPNPEVTERYRLIQPTIDENPDKYIVANLGITGFNMATFLRGFENFVMDIYIEEDNANALLDIILGFEEQVCRHYCSFDIDAVAFFDDWGSQKNLLVSPEKWREFFKPRYKKQFDLIHSLGKKVFFHCCGQISDIIPDLCEIGADILNLNQPELFGIEEMGRLYGGKACFCCPVDHQTVALTGSREEIFDYVRRLHESLGSGFIGYIEDYRSCGMTDERYHDIVDAFMLLNSSL